MLKTATFEYHELETIRDALELYALENAKTAAALAPGGNKEKHLRQRREARILINLINEDPHGEVDDDEY